MTEIEGAHFFLNEILLRFCFLVACFFFVVEAFFCNYTHSINVAYSFDLLRYEQPALLAVLVAYGLLGAAVAAQYSATVMAQARALLLKDKSKVGSSDEGGSGSGSEIAAKIKSE